MRTLYLWLFASVTYPLYLGKVVMGQSAFYTLYAAEPYLLGILSIAAGTNAVLMELLRGRWFPTLDVEWDVKTRCIAALLAGVAQGLEWYLYATLYAYFTPTHQYLLLRFFLPEFLAAMTSNLVLWFAFDRHKKGNTSKLITNACW